MIAIIIGIAIISRGIGESLRYQYTRVCSAYDVLFILSSLGMAGVTNLYRDAGTSPLLKLVIKAYIDVKCVPGSCIRRCHMVPWICTV